jgi:hypothetical protein
MLMQIGSFAAGKRHGQGKFTYANGDAYEGSWENDLKHGNGEYIYAKGSKKVGQWVNGNLTGKGQIVHADHIINTSFINSDQIREPLNIKFNNGFEVTTFDPAFAQQYSLQPKSE